MYQHNGNCPCDLCHLRAQHAEHDVPAPTMAHGDRIDGDETFDVYGLPTQNGTYAVTYVR